MENVTILSESGIVAVGDAAKKLKVEDGKYNHLIEQGRNFEAKNTAEVAGVSEQKPIEATNIETVEEATTPIIETKEEPVRPIIPETKEPEIVREEESAKPVTSVETVTEENKSTPTPDVLDTLGELREKSKKSPERILERADSIIAVAAKKENPGTRCYEATQKGAEDVERIKNRVLAKKDEIKSTKDSLVAARSEINAKKSDVKIVESVIEPYNPNTSSVTPILGRGNWQGDEPGDITRGMTAIAEEYTRLVTIVDEMKETIVTEERSAEAIEQVISELETELSNIINELDETIERVNKDVEKAVKADKKRDDARRIREEAEKKIAACEAEAEEFESDISYMNRTSPETDEEVVTEEKSDKIRSLAELKRFLQERDALIKSGNDQNYTEPNPFDRFRNNSRRAA